MARVTALTPQKERPDRYNLFLDGEFAVGLALDVVVRHGLRVGDELSPLQVVSLQEDEGTARALSDAYRLLSFRPRSRAEVVRYLTRREVDAPTVERVLARLAELGLIDDREFAAYWVENRQAFRPRGPRALQAELRQKGVGQQEIEAAVDTLAGDEEAAAESVARPRAARLSGLDAPSFRKKLSDFLLRRGFSYGVVRRVTDRLWTEQGGAPPDDLGDDEANNDP